MKLALLLGAALTLSLASVAFAAAERPQPLDDARLAELVKNAPTMPGKLDLDLKLKLIDFIDCTADKDPHGFLDQGTSKVTTGPAGKCRVTAGHRHAFFSYRFRGAGKDKPCLLVIEYPDDAERRICFFTHESGLSGRANNDWSLETGVYCGGTLPLSNKMQYHTFVYWPQDEWPAVLVANWGRTGGNGAASRIWVYAIEGGLPKLDVKEPDPANPRLFGHYNSIHFLPTSFYFGYRSPHAVEHMLDWCQYVGVNELSWTVVYNNTWGFSCKIPSWDGGDKNDELGQVLAAMDTRGGMYFTAGFFVEGSFKMGGKAMKSLSADELKAALFKGLDEFLDNYGKYKSLRVISLGAMYGIECIEPWEKSGLLAELVAHIKARKPGLLVETYVGGKALHLPYFAGRDEGDEKMPSTWDVISGWETSGKPWSQYLGERALGVWKDWKHDPAELKKAGLTVLEQLQPDDHYVFNYYGGSPDPRAMMYYDLDRSQGRCDAVASDRAALWNTHYEGWFGLEPNVNFWYRKLWCAPDFSPPEPLSMAPFANALGLRDRVELIPGSWNVRYFGHEATVRKWAKAFRELPAVEMKEVPCPVDTIKVRRAIVGGVIHEYVVSLIPFPSEATVSLMGKVTIPPYGVLSVVSPIPNVAPPPGKTEAPPVDITPKVDAQPCAEYRKFVEGRIADYKKLLAEVKALDSSAVPKCYTKVAEEAEKLVAAGKLYAADITLGAGLVNEMRLRKAILAPPELSAPKIAAAPPLNGDLDAWPKGASDLKADTGDYLTAHLYFPISWSGPDDLSVRLRLAHDGTKLYVGIEVRDQALVALKAGSAGGRDVVKADSLALRFSRENYRNWKGPAGLAPDFSWAIDLPIDKAETKGQGKSGFQYTCRRTKTGYVVEGAAPLAELKLQAGDSVGFLLAASDVDVLDNLKNSAWGVKQILFVPNRPMFENSDARNFGKLTLGK